MKRGARWREYAEEARAAAVRAKLLPVEEARIACPECGSRDTQLVRPSDPLQRPFLACPCGMDWRVELRRKP